MKEKQLMEMDMADTIIDRPHGFSVGDRHFYMYPVTLGKMYLLSRLVEELQINHNILKANPYIEALRLANERKDICSRIITYHTIHTKAKIFDNEFVEKRSKFFVDKLDMEDMATLLVLVLTSDKTDSIMKYLKIDKEQERMELVTQVKVDKNNISFGGLSVYGAILDAACERYHWTFDYVVWEISYTNLRLMLADKITSVYLSDKEIRKLPASMVRNKRNVIRADDPKNRDMIRQMDWR